MEEDVTTDAFDPDNPPLTGKEVWESGREQILKRIDAHKADVTQPKRAKIQFDPDDGVEMWRLVRAIIPLREQADRVEADELQRNNPKLSIKVRHQWTAPRLVLDLLRTEAMRLGLDPANLTRP